MDPEGRYGAAVVLAALLAATAGLVARRSVVVLRDANAQMAAAVDGLSRSIEGSLAPSRRREGRRWRRPVRPRGGWKRSPRSSRLSHGGSTS